MKEKGRKMGLKLLVLGLLLLFVPVLAFAQDYPTKSVTITTTFGPGTPIDLVNRILASRVEKILGQPFIINNSPPGGGMVATSKAAKEQPDGYQLLFTTTTTLLWIPQFRKANFSYEDFVPIMQFGIPAVGLVVRSDAPYKTLKELVEYARKNPGKITYGATAKSTPKQVVMDAIAIKEKVKWTFIPYDADNLSLAGLLGGHIDVLSASPVWIPHVKEGRLRLLAVYGQGRMQAFPDVKTVKELGYDFMDPAVYLLVGPKGIPSSIVNKLDDAFHKAMDDPEFVKIMDKSNYGIVYRGSSELKSLMESLNKDIGKLKGDLMSLQ